MALRLTEKEFNTLITKGSFQPQKDQGEETKKENKYRNSRVEYDGRKFDSVKERDRYITLIYMQKAKIIRDLQCQVRFVLEDAVEFKYEKRKKLPIRYFADFTYILNSTNELVVEDVKSIRTRSLSTYRLKKHLMKARWKIDIVEI